MPQYDSYPVVAGITDPDVILFHKDSVNAERLISFSNVLIDVLSGLPVSGLVAVVTPNNTDNIILDDTGTIKRITVQALSDALITHIPLATTSNPGLMSAADKTLIDAATSNATASTLVKRDAFGQSFFFKTFVESVIFTSIIPNPFLDQPSANTIRCNGNFIVGASVGSGTLTVNGSAVFTSPSTHTTINGTNINTQTVLASTLISIGPVIAASAAVGTTLSVGGLSTLSAVTFVGSVSSGVNTDPTFIALRNNVSSNPELILGSGFSERIIMRKQADGTRFIRFTNGGTEQVLILSISGGGGYLSLNDASSNSQVSFDGSVVGGAPTFGVYAAGVVAQAGYVTITDSGGTPRRLLVG